jgi:hypothetical protein
MGTPQLRKARNPRDPGDHLSEVGVFLRRERVFSDVSLGRSVVNNRSSTFSAAARRDGRDEYTATSARVVINSSGRPTSMAMVIRAGTNNAGWTATTSTALLAPIPGPSQLTVALIDLPDALARHPR